MATDEQYSPEEIVRRRDDAIRRALSTPPKPNSAYVGKGKGVRAAKKSRVKKRNRSD
jgi:hypothetical protein